MEPLDQFLPMRSQQNVLSRYQKDSEDLSEYIIQGQHISDLRDLADLSIVQLAKATNISERELLALEAGMLQLKPAHAVRIANALGVEYSDMWKSQTS